MSVIVKEPIFILETKNTHYVVGTDDFGNAHQIYWGRKCPVDDYEMPDVGDRDSNHKKLDEFFEEYTPFGKTMYRECAVKATFADGCREINLTYVGYKADGNRLSLTFKDVYYPLQITLHYTAYDDSDIIVRSVTLQNTGSEDITLEKVYSAEITLPGTNPYHILNTYGIWGAEHTKTDALLDGGALVFESRYGRSGHNHSPYFVAHRGANEENGEVYFANLAWSGSFKVHVSRDIYGITRGLLGINDLDFEYVLGGGDALNAPEVILGMAEGLGGMSRMLNDFGVNHWLPKYFNDKPLPVLYNSWEATDFRVSTDAQSALARKAAAAGCELFVMDDGWFGERKDDHAGLGDWFVNKEKFPNGLGELIANVNAEGMDFGLWFEPEMVNPDSDLYRAHPDWAYHYPHRESNEMRWQLVLNMTKPEVQEYIFERLDDMLSTYNIKYIKWDMNRPLSETGAENLAHPKMHWYLFTDALYKIVDRLRERHPDVQFESCSSGGGRCDWGALKHFDMVWTSDNTDSIDRITIQKGYALTRPIKTMRAWVTDVNWYNRNTPLAFRFNIAMRGALSLGGNLNHYTEEDIAVCRRYTDLYKEIRPLVQFGDLYRLLDYDKDEISAEMYVAKDKTEAALFIAAVNTRCIKKPVALYLDGLDDRKIYEFDFDSAHFEKSGAYLKNAGIRLEAIQQYYNKIIRIKEKK